MTQQQFSTHSKGERVSLGAALGIYFGSLIVALFLTTIVDGIFQRNQLAFASPFSFPLGLLMAFTPGEIVDASDTWTFVGCAIYAVLLGCFVTIRRRPTFYALVALYVVILLINVAGCTQKEYSFKMNCFNDEGIPAMSSRSVGAS